MSDFAAATFALECFTAVFGAVFGWLAWASGYMQYMVDAARSNHWGLDMLRGKKTGAEAWEETISR